MPMDIRVDVNAGIAADFLARSLTGEDEHSSSPHDIFVVEEGLKAPNRSNFCAIGEPEVAARNAVHVNSNGGGLWREQDWGEVKTSRASNADLYKIDMEYLGSSNLVTELQEASDAIEEMEGRVLVKLMVGEAVLKGIVKGLEADASVSMETTKSEIVQLKQALICKHELVERLNGTLQKKENEVLKLVEDSKLRLSKAFIDTWNEKEKNILTLREHEKVLEKKEEELSMMAQSMVELSFKLEEEGKRVAELKSQVKESRERESLTSSEVSSLREKMKEIKADQEVARLNELHMAENLSEVHATNQKQLGIIKQMASVERDLKEELQGKRQEVNSLLQAQHDNSVLVEKQVAELKADHRQSMEKQHNILKEESKLLQSKIEELSAQRATLAKDLESARGDLKAKDCRISKQTDALAKAALRSEELSIWKQKLRQEMDEIGFHLRLRETESEHVMVEMEDQRWRHEAEVSVIIGLCEGTITDFIKDINMLRQGPGLNRPRHIFKLKALEEIYLQLTELLCAKAASEAKASELDAKIRSQTQELQDHIKLLDKQTSLLTRLQDRINYLELKSSQDEEHIYRLETETEEHAWKCDSELDILITYIEGTFKDLSDMATDWGQRWANTEKVLILSQNKVGDLEARLSTRNEEADKLRSKNGTLSRFVDLLTKQVESCSGEVSAYKKTMKDSNLKVESLKSRLIEAQCLKMELEEKLSGKTTEFLQLVDELEEIRVQLKLEGVIILGFAEGLGNDVVQKLHQVEGEFKVKDEEVRALRKQVKEQKEKLHLHNSELSDLKGAESRNSQQLHALHIDTEFRIAQQAKAIEQEQLRVIEMSKDLEECQMALKLRDNKIQSLQGEVERQKEMLDICHTELSDFKITLLNKTAALLEKAKEPRNARKEVELLKAKESAALDQEDPKVAELLKKFSSLVKEKQLLNERVVAELVNVQKLEEELEDLKWLHETEMGIITFLLAEGAFKMGDSWNAPKVVMSKDIEILRQELNEKSFSGKGGNAVVFPRESVKALTHDRETDDPRSEEVKSTQTIDADYSPLSQKDLIHLRREISELRREKEQLSEQRIEEIYKLKRDFYKEFDKFKLQVLSKKGSDTASLAWVNELELSARESKRMTDLVTVANLISDNKSVSELNEDWNSEKSTLMETISQRDTQFEEVSNRLSQALEKERNHVSTRASLVENLAALEKERNRLDFVHQREKEKLISSHSKILKEKEEELSRGQVTIVEQVTRNASLELELKQSKEEIGLVRNRVQVFKQQLEVEVIEQLQSLMGASHHLEHEVILRTEQQSSRLSSMALIDSSNNVLPHAVLIHSASC